MRGAALPPSTPRTTMDTRSLSTIHGTRRHARPRLLAPTVAGLLLAAGAITFTATPAAAADLPLTQYVNPYIGTDDSNSPNPVPGGAGGSTVPGPLVPFGMVQFGPDTPTALPSGYRFADNQIQEFSLTHFNGAGCPNNEDIGILPITGGIGASPGDNWTSYAATQNKSQEQAVAGYYRAVLSNYGNTVAELTATKRTAMMRLTYPATNSARVLVNPSRSATGSRTGSLSISGSTVTGTATGGGFCGSSKTYQIFFRMEFDRAPTGVGTFNGGTVSNGSTSVSGVNAGGFVTFDTSGNQVVQVKVGISFVSQANAQANLNAENTGYAFDTRRAEANAAWNSTLNRVQVTGGATTDLQKFYTALYHVLCNPNIASDVNGQYRGFDNVIHSATHAVYQNYSGWDIYRSWAALVALIAPTEATDIARSMVLDGQQGGLIPKWSHNHNEHFVMNGDPGPIIVAELYAFGARNFDTNAALTLMERASNGGTTQGSAIRGRQAEYVQRQYIYDDSSDSLEYSASDFAVAQFAQALGNTSSYNVHMQRAQWWRNVFNTESSYIHRRLSDGNWPWPLNPADQAYWTEGNASQYTWMVPYNFASLINLMGGRQTAIQRLDHHFTELNGGLTRPYFYIGNEPEHGVPWAYHFAAHPAGTSAVVRRVMTESFTTGAGGLPGNEDLGATSAWYVWSALGMYPPTPGADTLALHGPLFPSATLQLANGNVLQINGSGAGQSNQYVQSLAVNGTSTNRNWLRYGDIASGGTLKYTMGSSPSNWGTNPADVPPSFNDGFSPPSPAPELGTNLALGKSATSSAPCAAAESAAKAFDGVLANNSKWCTLDATKFLQVDLGSNQNVTSFVLKHAGLGGEQTGWNTGAFNIQTSTDGVTFSTAVNVSGQRSSRTYHPVTARTARYVRLNITTPTNDGDSAARIYEFEVYGTGGQNNIALNRPATASSSCNANEGPEKAVNGSVGGGNSDKWCAAGTNQYLQVDLGSGALIGSFIVRHAGAGGETSDYNTRDFDLVVSNDGSTWTTAVTARGNTTNVTNHPLGTPVSARYVRLNAITPTQTGETVARIYELEVYGGGGGTSNVALNQPATASSQCATSEGPEKAFNGSVGGGNTDKWCGGGANLYLQVDLGTARSIKSFTVRHAGGGGEAANYNTRDFDLVVSNDGSTWTTAVTARGNTASVSDHSLSAPVSARYVRLNVITPTQIGEDGARIYELEVYA
jgi:predicted alpha-1,2-mannosidase